MTSKTDIFTSWRSLVRSFSLAESFRELNTFSRIYELLLAFQNASGLFSVILPRIFSPNTNGINFSTLLKF